MTKLHNQQTYDKDNFADKHHATSVFIAEGGKIAAVYLKNRAYKR